MTTRRVTCTYPLSLDKVGTMNRTQPTGSRRMNIFHGRNWKIGKIAFVSIALAISTVSPSHAQTPSQLDSLRLYAHSKIFSFDQFLCFNELIYRESRWNPRAFNGNHYGLAQGLYQPLLTMDPYAQVDWAIAYMNRRYKSECKALEHSDRYGWY